MTAEVRGSAAEYFNVAAADIADRAVETMIEQSLAVDTTADHERDN